MSNKMAGHGTDFGWARHHNRIRAEEKGEEKKWDDSGW